MLASSAIRSLRWAISVAILAFITSASIPGFSIAAQSCNPDSNTVLVSAAQDGSPAAGASYENPTISADGRYIAYADDAANIAPGDTNKVMDVFVYDRQTCRNSRVSVASDGKQADGESREPAISADGRYVAFYSKATNLVPNDQNVNCTVGNSETLTNCPDVFIHDMQTGVTSLVSVASDGSQANGLSYEPAISADGRYIAFTSDAKNLVSGNYFPRQIYLHDMQTGATTLISKSTQGAAGLDGMSILPAISADGRYIVFQSAATNLVPGDTNRDPSGRGPQGDDIFLHDMQSGATTRISVASDGSQANGDSRAPAISANGRYVTFTSQATNLVQGKTNMCGDAPCWDVYLHDMQTGATSRISVASDGTQASGDSGTFGGALLPAHLSADGRLIIFESDATNLTSDDANQVPDIFMHDQQTGKTIRLSQEGNSANGYNGSDYSDISADGRFVVYNSFPGSGISGSNVLEIKNAAP